MVVFLARSLKFLALHISISQSISLASATCSSLSFPSPIYGCPSSLQLTAIVGRNNQSTFQCWQLQPKFEYPKQPGIVGAKLQQLGDISSASLVMFNSVNVTYAGTHNAPTPQFVVFLSGGGYIRLPTSGQYLPITEGSIIIANDTAPVSAFGHDSVWFSGTVALQLPFASGSINHTVVSNEPCFASN